ncbi:MAG: radical SAM protein [Coriobacteriales bacterium]|jgi:uncharacterized radical SAM superfamily Fe-S cluster-containing enzyme
MCSSDNPIKAGTVGAENAEVASGSAASGNAPNAVEQLGTTEALCPECLAVLEASIYSDEQGSVWMGRTCPEHGEFHTFIWPDADHYKWMRSLAFPKNPPSVTRPVDKPCPTDCGICARHQRKPTLVEIEVTQSCNLRCPVCFMSAEADPYAVTLEQIDSMYDAIAEQAGTQTGVQLTGGEPTTRRDLPQIIKMGRDKGFWGIEVNTNGVVISRDLDYLRQLVDAGCTGIYMQFDGVTSDVYEEIRGLDLLQVKLDAIENCRVAGIQVVLAMTIVSGINDDQIGKVIDFALDNNDTVLGVALQPAFTSGRFEANRVKPLTMGDVIFDLEDQTNGLIKVSDIWPLGCSNPFCDTGTYLVMTLENGKRVYTPCTRDLTREQYLDLYDKDSPQGSVFWDIVQKSGIEAAGGLSVIIMNYMDAATCDLQRMKECSMFDTMKDGRLIPFCAYQLTDGRGRRIHPPWGDSEE